MCECVEGGVDRVQIRDRSLDGRALFAFSQALAVAVRTKSPDVQIIVNRRIDVALAIGADGAHLGFDAVTPEQARDLLGPEAAIGVSTHSIEETRRAMRAGADYVHLAPVFAPLSKPATRPALGLDRLAKACAEWPGVIAQGGVDASTAAAIIRAGAVGVAATGSLLGADDPRRAAAAIRSALDEAARRR